MITAAKSRCPRASPLIPHPSSREEPASSREEPASSREEPASSREEPASSLKEPASSRRRKGSFRAPSAGKVWKRSGNGLGWFGHGLAMAWVGMCCTAIQSSQQQLGQLCCPLTRVRPRGWWRNGQRPAALPLCRGRVDWGDRPRTGRPCPGLERNPCRTWVIRIGETEGTLGCAGEVGLPASGGPLERWRSAPQWCWARLRVRFDGARAGAGTPTNRHAHWRQDKPEGMGQ